MTVSILQSQFIDKRLKKTENYKQNVVLLLFLFTLDFIFPRGKFGSPYLIRHSSCREQRYPFLPVCSVSSCVQTTVWLPVCAVSSCVQTMVWLPVCAVSSCVQTMVWLPVFGFFNVRTDVDACDCTRGLYGHRQKVGTGKLTGRKISCRTGTRTRVTIIVWLFGRTVCPPNLSPRPRY